MKHFKSLLLVLPLLAGALAFQACTADLLPDNSTGNNGDNHQPMLTVSVSDNGYAPADAPQGTAPSTRAQENDKTTVFTAGDQIGVYAVKEGAVMDGISNLCLTAKNSGSGSGVQWDIPEGTTLPNDATYYAYYPWKGNTALEGTVNAAATDADGFFAGIVSAWKPATDQSTYEKYTQQDLMTASGSISGTTLSFGMTHRMALVLIDLPSVTYRFTNTPTIADYTIAAPGAQFTDFTPYHTETGVYRYLIAPSADAPALEGSYSYIPTHSTATWSLTVSTLTAGNYRIFQIDGGSASSTATVKHDLQMGDFFMKDGTLIGKDQTLTEEQKNNCIGVVLKPGRDADGNWKDTDTYYKKGTTEEMTVHGYVLAKDKGNGGSACIWGNTGTTIGTDAASSGDGGDAATLFCGYSNTTIIKKYAKNNTLELQTAFPATYYTTDDFETRENGKHASPSHSSGWFLPSAGQLYYLYKNWYTFMDDWDSVTIPGALTKAGGNGAKGELEFYSSSESAANRSKTCYLSGPGGGNGIIMEEKSNLHIVIACLAF